MVIHENHLPADDSHEISCLICYFGKSSKILNCRLLQIIDGALRATYISCEPHDFRDYKFMKTLGAWGGVSLDPQGLDWQDSCRGPINLATY